MLKGGNSMLKDGLICTLLGQRDVLVPRLCLGTHCLAGSACRSANQPCFVSNRTRGGASGAVRSQAEPGNERQLTTIWRSPASCFIWLMAIASLGFAHGAMADDVTSSVVVVRPKAWEGALKEWLDYRAHNYHVIQVDSVESAQELRRSILWATEQALVPVTAVLLCGDVGIVDDSDSKNPRFIPLTPTFQIPTTVKLGPFTTPTLATDLGYGNIDGDECPELAVGRLPAKSPEDLSRMLRRSIDYEQSQSIGPWRDRIHATAGVGGFGVLADTAIESVARRLLSEGIPDRFQLNMTYASLTSPYCPDPFSLTRSFISKINEGGLFWVYIGHGNVDRLDDFMVGDEAIPICLSEHVSQFAIPDGPSIALMLACFTGAFDARVDCFAETLLARNDGPIAVIAGSRVTMPYGLSQLSTEMMDGCFRDQIPTLGEILLNAKRNIWKKSAFPTAIQDPKPAVAAQDLDSSGVRLRAKQRSLMEQMAMALSPEGHDLTEERREHVRLMNLLGDPLLRIRHPISMPVRCEGDPLAGKPIVISGNSPHPGKLKVELALSRDRLPDGVQSVSDFRGTDAQRKTMQANYSRASDLVLVKSEQKIASGEFSVELLVPEECRGRCVLRAFVYGNDEWASGSQRVNVRRLK